MKRLLVIVPVVLVTACSKPSNSTPKHDAAEHALSAQAGKPVADNCRLLLDMAFAAVGKMPEDPHLKTKARLQYELVGCALDLKQPVWAEGYADQSLYWEKGAAYADIALYQAERGNTNAAKDSLSRAEAWLEENEPVFAADQTEQSWRTERVKTKIIQAGIALGDVDVERKYGRELEVMNASVLVRQKARTMAGQDGDAPFSVLSDLAATGDFEAVKNAVAGMVDLYNLHYGNEALRKAIKDKVSECCTNTPLAFRIDMLDRLGEVDLEQGSPSAAQAFADEARSIIDARQNPPRFQIPLAAEIASLHCRAGEEEKGRKELEDCIRLFDEQNRLILNIDQAGILCSVAEAYQNIGEPAKALELYRRAIEAGQVNPNSRPRVEDLCRICCSIARSGITPSAELLQSLATMNNGLGNPW